MFVTKFLRVHDLNGNLNNESNIRQQVQRYVNTYYTDGFAILVRNRQAERDDGCFVGLNAFQRIQPFCLA